MINNNDVNYMKIEVNKHLMEENNVIEFLIFQNFQLYLQNRNIKYSKIYENHYKLFADKYKKYIIKKGGFIYIAIYENKIIGALYIDTQNYLDSLFVKDEYRKEGIGSNLLNKMISESIEKNITITCNKDLIDFYKQFGFVEVDKNIDNKNIYELIYKK